MRIQLTRPLSPERSMLMPISSKGSPFRAVPDQVHNDPPIAPSSESQVAQVLKVEFVPSVVPPAANRRRTERSVVDHRIRRRRCPKSIQYSSRSPKAAVSATMSAVSCWLFNGRSWRVLTVVSWAETPCGLVLRGRRVQSTGSIRPVRVHGVSSPAAYTTMRRPS